MLIRPIVLGALFSLVSTPVLLAGPITGQEANTQAAADQTSGTSSGGATDTSFTAGSLFDPSAGPLLHTAGVQYLQLGTRNKLRHVSGISGDQGGGSGYYSATGGGGVTTFGAAAGGDAAVIGNLTPEVPLGSTDPLLSFTPLKIPEPATLLLLTPGVLLALRLRARARRRS